MKLLITGASGLLGNNLAYYFKDKYKVMGLYCSHPVTIDGAYTQKCDLLQTGAFKKTINEFNPSIIIHCASLANIDQCKIDKNIARKINVLSTKYLVKDVMANDIKLIYISTDAVYDGVKGSFSEDDDINPLNYYGLSKYKGELEVQKKRDSLVIRTNLFGWNIQDKHSIAEWILNKLSNNKPIQGFQDAYFSSIYTFELARILDRAIDKDLTGVYNCASRTSMSKYEFALHLANRFNLDASLIEQISIDGFGFKAKRGKNLSLNVDKISSNLDCKLPTIIDSIERFYEDYQAGLPAKIKQKKESASITAERILIPLA